MRSPGAQDANVEFRDIIRAPGLKLRGKHFCTNLTSKGQRGVFLSLYHQGNSVRTQPAGNMHKRFVVGTVVHTSDANAKAR